MSSEKKNPQQPYNRSVTDETVFKVVKEIMVKFIEVGRVTPANFDVTYNRVYKTVKDSIQSQ